MGGALITGGLAASSLNPHVETFSGCAKASEVLAEQLKRESRPKELYYTPLTLDMPGQDARMFTALGASGLIFYAPFKHDARVRRFTGTVYKRKVRVPERAVGGVRDRLYYEVVLSDETVFLYTASFDRLPVAICSETIGP